MEIKLLNGDCLDKLKELENNSIDSIVTDPPYGLSFMGKKWDYDVPSVEIWEECMRVLKPGGHLLAFAGSRTYHRMAVRIEDAGFEIRDQIMWIYGSGFPKSHNIGKAVDKLEGNQREVVGSKGSYRDMRGGALDPNLTKDRERLEIMETKGNSDWEGWGTALKPAHEPIVMARKPLSEKSVADNVLEWGTGGINIDGCRVGNERVSTHSNGSGNTGDKGIYSSFGNQQGSEEREGRFPANIIFECTCENPKVKENTNTPYNYNENEYKVDGFISNIKPNAPSNYNDTNSGVIHTDPNCPCYILDQQSGNRKGWADQKHNSFNPYGGNSLNESNTQRDGIHKGYNDNGGASRFFYCPKASKKDRDEGMPEGVPQFTGRPRREDGSVIYKETHPEEWAEAMAKKDRKDKTALAGAEEKLQELNGPKQIKGRDAGQDSRSVAHKARPTARMNIHPTVKPTDLMGYLIRLVTPKGGIVLDPFMGSGSTGKAAVLEGMGFVGIERELEYYEIAKQRIDFETNKIKFW